MGASNMERPEQWLVDVMGGRKNRTGVSVNATTALQVTTVFACVRLISEQIATLPFQLYQATNGGRQKARGHPVNDLLNIAPNPYQTAYDFWRMMLFNHILWGDCFAEIEYDKGMQPIALWPIPTNLVTKTINSKTGEPAYTVAKRDGFIFPEKMLHIPGAGVQQMYSFDPITLAREAIGLAMNAEDFSNEYFSNGSHPSGIVTLPGQLKQDRVDDFKKEIKGAYTGSGKRSRLMVLENGMAFTKLQLPANEGQMIESRKLQVEEICRFFNVPPFKVMSFDKATYSNYEEASISFVQDTLVPFCVAIQQAVNAKLLLLSERKQGYYAEFNMNGLLRGRIKDRYDAYMVGISIGALSPNEVRELENRENIGADGDKYFISQNLREITEQFEQKGADSGNAGVSNV